MYAFSKFNDSGTKRLQDKIEQAIKVNLSKIAGLKDIISKVEKDNDELARKAIALKLMEHSPSGETDDSVEDWVDNSP